MPSAAAPLLDRLRKAAGPEKRLRFDAFMETVLYDPDWGYFSRDPLRAGRQGDFLTSVEVAPLFASCVARFLERSWDALGKPARLDVVEVGAGRGTLARDLLDVSPPPLRRALRLHLVERSPTARGVLRTFDPDVVAVYEAVDELPDRFPAGALVANELFDNLPVRRVMKAKGWKEIVVRVNGSRLREDLVEAAPDLLALVESHHVRLQEGQSAEVCPTAAALLDAVLRRFDRGAFLVLDYGDEAESLHARFPDGTLATHRAQASGREFYDALGEQDVTAHVNFTVLREAAEGLGYAARLTIQTDFLVAHGLPELVAARLGEELDEFAKLRLAQAARILYHPDAMGGAFRALTGLRSA